MSAEPNTIITMSSVFVSLIPVLIGGILAAGGGLAGAYLNHKFSREASKSKLRREKLEQLADAAYRTVHWLNQFQENLLFGEGHSLGLSPISEVEYLSKLYFKELREETALLSLAAADMSLLITDGNSYKIETGKLPDDFMENYKDLYQNLSDCLRVLIEKMSEVASEV